MTMGLADLDEMIRRTPFIVMDGGMGTCVEDLGLDVRNPLWGSVAFLTREGRSTNDRIHAEFRQAGAELLITNTHNASWFAAGRYLEVFGIDRLDSLTRAAVLEGSPDARREWLGRFVNTEAVASARLAAPKGLGLVAGSVGGVELAYAKKSALTADEVVARLSDQVEHLASADVDLLLFEMVSTSAEVEGIARLLQTLAKTHPALGVGVGFPASEAGVTHGGVSMTEAVDALRAAPPRLFFVQCTRHDLVEQPLVELIRKVGDPRKVGVYANDGRRWIDGCWHGDRISPEQYAEVARVWAAHGVSVIGGCCGTGPEHVAALVRLRASLAGPTSA